MRCATAGEEASGVAEGLGLTIFFIVLVLVVAPVFVHQPSSFTVSWKGGSFRSGVATRTLRVSLTGTLPAASASMETLRLHRRLSRQARQAS